MLVTWEYSPKKAKETTARFMEWNPKGKYSFLYLFSSIIGSNKGFCVLEVDDLAELQKDLGQWNDLMTFTCLPCMDSRDAIAVIQ